MFKVHFEILPKNQLRTWERLISHASFLNGLGFYLAGGTALSLQLGHRRSVDFDFFSQRPMIGEKINEWLQEIPGATLRDIQSHTVHADINGAKVSWIGNYKYPLIKKTVQLEKIKLASVTDIGLMKLLAITHRATLRDYIDLAAILRDHVPLRELLKLCRQKYGRRFNEMIPLKALVSFHDIENEKPTVLDKSLQRDWKKILINASKKIVA